MITENRPYFLDEQKSTFIETGTTLLIDIEGFECSFKSLFVGMKFNEYIVVTPPSPEASDKAKIPEGAFLNVRYLCGGKSFSFQTRLIKMASNPVDLLLLSFPESIKSGEKRSQKRINCFLSAKVEFKTGEKGEVIHGVIKDISKTGCRFQFTVPESKKDLFKVDEEAILRCHFPGISGEQSALGKFIDVLNLNGEISVGIQFSTMLWWVPPYE
jgi:c-di-GMP-binding flagellar brake protein YcgR